MTDRHSTRQRTLRGPRGELIGPTLRTTATLILVWRMDWLARTGIYRHCATT